MIKSIATAAVILSMASSAIAGTVIQTNAFGGDNGGATDVFYQPGANSSSYQSCKTEIEGIAAEYVSEYNATIVSRKADSGSTVDGNGRVTGNKWFSYDLVLKYPFAGHSVLTCTYFQ